MTNPQIYHCGCGTALPLDDSIPLHDLIVHLGHPGGMFEPSLMWSLNQVSQSLRRLADAVLEPPADWLADKIVRWTNRHHRP